MELFCTAKGIVVEIGDCVECAVFMLRDWHLEPGTRLEQRREEEVVATWELVEHQPRALLLKKQEGTIEQADGFYAIAPVVVPVPVVSRFPPIPEKAGYVIEAAPEGSPETETHSVLIFGGKNWKLASHKKWVPGNLSLIGCPIVGDIIINGKGYFVHRLPEGFAALLDPKEQAAS